MGRSIVLLFFILTACGGTGTMHGLMRDSREMISINYTEGMYHDNLTVTMPDGEAFTGKAVMVDSSASFVGGYGMVVKGTGNIHAVLFGDRGNTMRCQFQYANPTGSTGEGGIGLCETSKGELVDVQW